MVECFLYNIYMLFPVSLRAKPPLSTSMEQAA